MTAVSFDEGIGVDRGTIDLFDVDIGYVSGSLIVPKVINVMTNNYYVTDRPIIRLDLVSHPRIFPVLDQNHKR